MQKYTLHYKLLVLKNLLPDNTFVKYMNIDYFNLSKFWFEILFLEKTIIKIKYNINILVSYKYIIT